MSDTNEWKAIANFLYEAGILAKTPRSGLHFLGTGQQSVAEHLHRTAIIGYALSVMDGEVDSGKVMKMCLLHDIAESRVSDLNYVHQKYVDRHEDRVIEDLAATLPFGDDLKQTMEEYGQRQSREAIVAKEADNLEWVITLKEQFDIGNARAKDWIPNIIKRLKTDHAKSLAAAIMGTESTDWWFTDKDDEWWVSRKKKG